ncbi:hypothetical protein C8Q74DRAFT_654193 [Fomes fomentarius]|nr:hypothetical protein C8Q74DRAFT_654193 [Fomes fomentarius]
MELQAPRRPICDALIRFLSQGLNEQICDSWRSRKQTPVQHVRTQMNYVQKSSHRSSCSTFMKNLVDDFIALYDEGVIMQTKCSPQGRHLRVALVVVCCDHPTMCKVGGFWEHSKERRVL